MASKQDLNSSCVQHIQQSRQDTRQSWGSGQLPQFFLWADKYLTSRHFPLCSQPIFLHSTNLLHATPYIHLPHFIPISTCISIFLLWFFPVQVCAYIWQCNGQTRYVEPWVKYWATCKATPPASTAPHPNQAHTSLASKKTESGLFQCDVSLVQPAINQKPA